jgi:hypothetical protein
MHHSSSSLSTIIMLPVVVVCCVSIGRHFYESGWLLLDYWWVRSLSGCQLANRLTTYFTQWLLLAE